MKTLDPDIKLQGLKAQYYNKIGMTDEHTRKHKYVAARYAFFVAAAARFLLVDVARTFGMTHTMIIHARKCHASNMRFSKEYPMFYLTAQEVMREFQILESVQINELRQMSVDVLSREIVRLRYKIREYEKQLSVDSDMSALSATYDPGEERQEVLQ